MPVASFFSVKSFFTYILGPFKKAKPVKTPIILRVKHEVNLAGESTIAGNSIKANMMKTKAVANAIPAIL